MTQVKYSWPLNDNPFSWLDRAKIASFVLNPKNRWTQGEQVAAFEREMAQYVGSKYAVFVSSGSTANTILAMYLADQVDPRRFKVVVPSTTWTTSVSPFIRESYTPLFVDVNMENLSMDLFKLESALAKESDKIAAVFITSLLGMVPDIERIQKLQEKYPDIRFWMDNCENTLGKWNGKNICSYFTSTTSSYFGHLINSTEGGFLFTNNEKEYEYFLMARNHGMTRSLPNPEKYRNHDVDARFDFNFLGNNFRNTDIAAKIGRLDLARADEYAEKRQDLYDTFWATLEYDKVITFHNDDPRGENVMFALPLIPNPEYYKEERALILKKKIDLYCEEERVEQRPLISGSLLRQTAYKKYGGPLDYPNSEYLHHFAGYVGLYPKLSHKKVADLANFINGLSF